MEKQSTVNYPTSLPEHSPAYFYSPRFLAVDHQIEAYYHTELYRGFPLNMHSHDFYEVNIITSGKGVHYINNGSIVVNIGDVFIIAPHSKHGYYNLGGLSIFHILIDNSFFEDYKSEFDTLDNFKSLFYIEPKIRATTENNAYFSMSKKQLSAITSKLNDLIEFNEKNKFNNILKKHLVAELICMFCMWYSKMFSTVEKVEKIKNFYYNIIKSMEYIETHFDEKITIEKLAQISFLSRSTYLRYFHTINNKTPNEYISELRIQKAKILLKTTNKSVSEIAVSLGFFDASHFERVFVKKVKISPSTFRAKN